MTTVKEKSRKEKRTIPPALMLRIKTCAFIFQADKPEKLNAIAQGKGVTLEEAGIAYTVGCIKELKRTGIANSYREALDILEARQVGDRGDSLNPPNELGLIVEKINRTNKGDIYTPAYVQSTDKVTTWTDVFPVNTPEKRCHSRNMGKVYGSLYTLWEANEEDSDPERIMSKEQFEAVQAHRDKHLKLFFADYTCRLSKTYQRRIQELKDNTETSAYLASRAGREDPKTKGVAIAVTNLFRNFPHREGLKEKEFIDLVRQYTPVSSGTDYAETDRSDCNKVILIKRPL
jgi:hypothetical protein